MPLPTCSPHSPTPSSLPQKLIVSYLKLIGSKWNAHRVAVCNPVNSVSDNRFLGHVPYFPHTLPMHAHMAVLGGHHDRSAFWCRWAAGVCVRGGGGGGQFSKIQLSLPDLQAACREQDRGVTMSRVCCNDRWLRQVFES